MQTIISNVKKAWEEKKENSKRSFSFLRKCIAKKANERKRKQLRKTPKPTVTDSTQHDDEISVIPTYRQPVSFSGTLPPTSM